MGDAILDGEIITADETGRPQFYDLLRQTRAPTYVAFDLIWLNGVDLRPLPLTERRRHPQNILPKGSAIVSEALSVTGRGHRLFELMCAHDLEGLVAKRLNDGYGSRVRCRILRVYRSFRIRHFIPGGRCGRTWHLVWKLVVCCGHGESVSTMYSGKWDLTVLIERFPTNFPVAWLSVLPWRVLW